VVGKPLMMFGDAEYLQRKHGNKQMFMESLHCLSLPKHTCIH